MKPGRAAWSLAGRLAFASLLLFWVFHAIFHDQARDVLAAQGVVLDALPRLERWGLVWRVGPAQLARTVVRIHPGWLAVSCLLWGVTLLVGVWRWQLVLRAAGIALSFRRAAEISLVAHFFNSFLLGSTGGDVLKAWYAARHAPDHQPEAVTTVVVDRILGLFTMLAFAVIMVLPNLDLLRAYRRMALLAWVVAGMALLAGGFLALSLRGGVSRMFPGARAWLRRLPFGATLERALEAGRSLGRRPGLLAGALGWSVVLNVSCVLQLLTLVWGYGLDLPVRALFFIVPAVICLAALPLTPSGLGVRDNLYVYLLTVPTLGVDAGTALAISLVAYACSLVWSVLGGLVYVAMPGVRAGAKELEQLPG
ncbi:MAG: YbhN family protein [Limisphaerales bacterium]